MRPDQPLHPTTSGGLTAAVVAGERRRWAYEEEQVLFAPGDLVMDAVVIAGSSARHRTCEAKWSKKGDHPLSRGVFVGPTYMTTYEKPLKGSAYLLRESGRK